MFSFYGKRLTTTDPDKVLTKRLAVSHSSTVHCGQHDTKYVSFELVLPAAFVADERLSDMLEPARTL